MFTIIYEPLNEAALLSAVGHKADQPSRAVQALSFWIGAEAEDGRKGPFSVRTGKPKVPETTDPMAAPFKIVVGGVYRCRDEWLVHIHRRRIGPLGQISFLGSRINPITSQAFPEREWGPDGAFLNATTPWASHDYTIVSPYVQPQES